MKDETILPSTEGRYHRKKTKLYRNQCQYRSRILSWVLTECRPHFFLFFCFFVLRDGLSHSTVNKYRIQFLCQKGLVNLKSTYSKSLASGRCDVVTHCNSTKKIWQSWQSCWFSMTICSMVHGYYFRVQSGCYLE